MNKLLIELLNNTSLRKARIVTWICGIIAVFSFFGMITTNYTLPVLTFLVSAIMAIVSLLIVFFRKEDNYIYNYNLQCSKRLKNIFKGKTKVEIEFLSKLQDDGSSIPFSSIYEDMFKFIKSDLNKEIKLFAVYNESYLDLKLDIELEFKYKDNEKTRTYKEVPIGTFLEVFKVVE